MEISVYTLWGHWNWYPAVGICSVIVGVVGAAAPFIWKLEKKENARKRGIWIAIMATLMVLELRSIHLDRAENERKENEARKSQLQNFDKIGSGITDSITQAKRHFDRTMQKFELVTGIQKQTLGKLNQEEEIQLRKNISVMPNKELAEKARDTANRMRNLLQQYKTRDDEIDNRAYNAMASSQVMQTEKDELMKQEAKDRDELRIEREGDAIEIISFANDLHVVMAKRLQPYSEDWNRTRFFQDPSSVKNLLWQIEPNAKYLDDLAQRVLEDGH